MITKHRGGIVGLARQAVNFFMFLAFLAVSLMIFIALCIFTSIAVFCWKAAETISEKLSKKPT